MRIIDGESPIKVWREKRGLTIRQLADAIDLHDVQLADLEQGKGVTKSLLYKISNWLDVPTDLLTPPKVAP